MQKKTKREKKKNLEGNIASLLLIIFRLPLKKVRLKTTRHLVRFGTCDWCTYRVNFSTLMTLIELIY